MGTKRKRVRRAVNIMDGFDERLEANYRQMAQLTGVSLNRSDGIIHKMDSLRRKLDGILKTQKVILKLVRERGSH